MLEDIPHGCPIITNLIMAVLVDCMLEGLLSLHLTLWLLRDVCCTEKGLFLSLSGSGGSKQKFTSSAGKLGQLVCWRGYSWLFCVI